MARLHPVPCILPFQLLALALPLCASPPASTPSGQAIFAVSGTSFSPSPFHVGDRVTAKARIEDSAAAPEPFQLLPGSGLPSGGGNPELLSASLEADSTGSYLRVVFVAWSPGRGNLPSLAAGGMRFPPIAFETASVLGPGERDPSPPLPQRDPPGTSVYLYSIVALLVGVALVALATVFWLLPGARALLSRLRARGAFRTLSRSLEWLEANAGVADPAPFYALLSHALRLYLARRLIEEAEALTPREIRELPALRFPDAEYRDELAELLLEADRARWGNLEASGAGSVATAAGRGLAARRARRLGQASEAWFDVRA